MSADRPRLSRGDLLIDAAGTLRARPGRAVALGLAVILGVATFVGVSSMSASANRRVADRVDGLRPELVQIEPTRDVQEVPDQYARLSVRAIDRSPAVRAAAVVARYPPASIRARTTGPASKASIVGAEGDVVGATRTTFDGSPLPVGGAAAEAHLALVGASVAADLDLADPSAAPTIWVEGVAFGVVGVITDSTYGSDLVDAVVIPRSIAAELLGGSARSTSGYLRTDRGAAPGVADALPLQLTPEAPESWSVQVPQVPIDVTEGISADLRHLTLALSALVLALGVVAIANAMLRAVYERTAEIGLRRSLGARGVHILQLLVLEAAGIGLVAGGLGVTLGVVVGGLIALRNGWPLAVDVASVALAVPGAALAGMVAGLVPGLTAVRITPSEALRRE